MTTNQPMLRRLLPAAFLTLAAVAGTTTVSAQEGAAQRVGQALDRVGKGIRREVETGVARGQMTAFERDLMVHLQNRLRWDKALVSSTLELQVQADGTVVLRGAVVDKVAKARAVDLAQSTVGVTTVVDELVIATTVKVVPGTPRPVIVTPRVIVAPVTPVVRPEVVVPVTPPIPDRELPVKPPVADPEIK